MAPPMKKQKSHVSKEEDRQTRSSTNGSREKMPADLVVETLSTLPAKTIAKCRCVSKYWATLLRTFYFIKLFLMRSSTRPRLLFTFQTEGKWSFYSSPQSLISNNNSSRLVVQNHMQVPRGHAFGICTPVNGFVCSKNEWILSGRRDTRLMIGNPSTGEFKSLPKVKSRRGQVISYIGYDPIGEQYKILCMTVCERPFTFKAEEYQVLTLGTGKLKWNMIECSLAHYPQNKELCINGVLYYLALEHASRKTIIVCFNVRNEVFSFIVDKAPKDIGITSTLVNYNGKIGAIHSKSLGFMDGTSTSFELWVIDDNEEREWSKHICILPPLWKDIVGGTKVYIVGMIGTSEIVFSPFILSKPFYIYHLNMERNSVTRVEIEGIGPLQGQNIYTFINHVENVKLLLQ